MAGESKKACCLISEMLEETGLDRETLLPAPPGAGGDDPLLPLAARADGALPPTRAPVGRAQGAGGVGRASPAAYLATVRTLWIL